MNRSFQTHIEKFDGHLWGLHFKVDSDIANRFKDEKVKRVLVYIHDFPPFHAGLMHLKTGIRFININQDFCKQHALKVGDTISVKLEKDESKYGMDMPEEFEVALEMDPDASDFFHTLTPGKMRNLIYFVGQTKSSNIRARRAWVVCDHLTSHKGLIDFKDLNAEIKEANNNAKLG